MIRGGSQQKIILGLSLCRRMYVYANSCTCVCLYVHMICLLALALTFQVIGEIMKLAEREISEGVHPRKLAEGLDLAREEALKFLQTYKHAKPEIRRDRELMECLARCSLSTKLDPQMTEQLTAILVDAIQCLLTPNEETVSPLYCVCVCVIDQSGTTASLLRALCATFVSSSQSHRKKTRDVSR